jgi:hypothetical protein
LASSIGGVQLGVGLAHAVGHRNRVLVGQDARAAVAHGLQRVGRRRHHQVAGQHRVGLLRVDAHLGAASAAWRARRTKDSTAPPFCAKPMKSSTLALWPCRCAAIVTSAPTVTTPVPPTPVTSRS